METRVFADYDVLSRAVAQVIADTVKEIPHAVLCLATGDTPRLAYTLIADIARRDGVDFSHCAFVALDEWVGVPPANEGSCAFFLQRYLFGPLAITPERVHLFDAMTRDLQAECRRMDQTITRLGGLDLAVVGVGMNGHIGFNEPGTAVEKYTHVASLDETTRTVGQKYFAEKTALKQGITLGFAHLLQSRTLVMMANGERKARVVKEALEGPETLMLPASVLRRHPRAAAFLDTDAAALLQTP